MTDGCYQVKWSLREDLNIFKNNYSCAFGQDKNNIRIFCFKRIGFGFLAAPYILGAIITHHLKKYNKNLVTELMQNIYMDDVILSANKT